MHCWAVNAGVGRVVGVIGNANGHELDGPHASLAATPCVGGLFGEAAGMTQRDLGQ
jgi:hypothetical protein